ncbi:MAG TPA: diguanylate cyclase [Candidatus Nanopelagicaceae bacterium]|nr:diguanylate cyclase [Candidatus Nanopelagicaceae bacterium]
MGEERAGAHRLLAPLRRVAAGVASVPWRRRAFWVTQLLVLAVVGIHFADDVYGSDLAHVPAVATLVLAVVPVGYAAIRFGLRGSLPTAMWTVVLMVPDLLFFDTGLERWTHGSMLTLVVIVGLAAGRMVDVQRSSTSRLFASERFRGIARVADQLPDGVCLTDLDGVITYANPAWARLQGLTSPRAAVGRTMASLHVDEHAEPGSAPYEQPLLAGGPLRSLVEHHRAGGDSHWADVTVSALLDEQGQAIGRLGTVRDVTAERAAAAALQEAQERFRVTFEQAPLGMAIITLEGGFLQVNDALCQILGRSAAEVIDMGVLSMVAPEDIQATQQLLRHGGSQKPFVQRVLHGDGHFVSLQISSSLVSDAAGKPLYLVAQFQDVTEERRRQSQLLHRASHDPLTGLANRVLFEDRVDRALARARRHPEVLAVLFCDLDDLKGINDRLGHPAGDAVLRTVATRLQRCVRDVDTVARVGGDEFVVLLEDIGSAEGATATATRILDALQRPLTVEGEVVVASVSIGIAFNGQDAVTRQKLIKGADAAMYAAKQEGGGRWQLFDAPGPRRVRR